MKITDKARLTQFVVVYEAEWLAATRVEMWEWYKYLQKHQANRSCLPALRVLPEPMSSV